MNVKMYLFLINCYLIKSLGYLCCCLFGCGKVWCSCIGYS